MAGFAEHIFIVAWQCNSEVACIRYVMPMFDCVCVCVVLLIASLKQNNKTLCNNVSNIGGRKFEARIGSVHISHCLKMALNVSI